MSVTLKNFILPALNCSTPTIFLAIRILKYYLVANIFVLRPDKYFKQLKRNLCLIYK